MLKPIEKNIHFFDLDGVLWETDSKVWVIDKENPAKPIFRIDYEEVNNILNGVYFNQKLKVEYNGKQFYISNNLFNKIIRKKKIAIERIGLSWIEFYDSEYINNAKVKYLLNNISHLKNKDDIICILTGRAYQDRHAQILNNLRKILLDNGFFIYKIYFVSDNFIIKHNEDIALRKSHILLEHMIGIKIENGKFISKKQDWYSNIYFYDDNVMNIEYANNIQYLFNKIMKKTNDELFLFIIERIKKYQSSLTTNLVSNNDINNFKKEKIILIEPVRYPIK